jgi:hypothetical protein
VITAAWADAYREATATATAAGPAEGGDGGDEGGPQRDVLVQLAAAAGAEFFHTPGDDDIGLYVTFTVHGHRETWPLGSSGSRQWLTQLFYAHTKRAPAAQPLQDAINTLRAKALFDGPECPVALRVGEHGGKVYLDLCDRDWRAVEVDADGWRVVSNPPVRFTRKRGMYPLPEPIKGGSVDELRPLVNLPDDAAWKLAVGFLLACLRPNRPFPILVVLGEQGSAKSHLCRLVRRLIDPNKAALRLRVRDERDLMIAANNGWLVALDNLSALPDWLSDALCSLTTGAGLGTRELFSDDNEKLFDAMRPCMVNGIGDVVVRGDAVDRGLFLLLPAIPDDRRQTADAVNAAFAGAHARVLGALLEGVSTALRRLPTTTLAEMPRMADFATWVEAGAPAFGWPPGAFLEAYQANRTAGTAAVLESSHVAAAVLALVEQDGRFKGYMRDLLKRLSDFVDEKVQKGDDWPKNPMKLRGQLDRLAPALRRAKVNVRYLQRTSKGTPVVLERVVSPPSPDGEGGGEQPSQPSQPSPDGTQDQPQKGVQVDDGLGTPTGPTLTTLTTLTEPSLTDDSVTPGQQAGCDKPDEPSEGSEGSEGRNPHLSPGGGRVGPHPDWYSIPP